MPKRRLLSLLFPLTAGISIVVLAFAASFAGGQWSDPVRLEGPINSDPTSKAWPSINATGDTIYYAKTGAELQENICYSYCYEDSLWSAPIFMPPWVNSPDQRDLSPSIGPGDSVLYFVTYERPGGYGSYDIWFTRRGSDGQWMEPENAGPNVNTTGMEWGVFLSRDGQTLYFSSTRQGGMGFLDIWKCGWADNAWGPAQHLEGNLNWITDEMNVTLPLDESYMVLTAYRYVPLDWELYLSFPTDTGWSTPQSIPELSSPRVERGASLMPDGRTIYFSSARNDSNNIHDDLFVSHRSDTVKADETFPIIVSNLDLRICPNPFNPSTTIFFTLPQRSPVQFYVYDVLGRLVQSVDWGILAAGEYRKPFDGSSFASGIYFTQMNMGNQSARQRMVLLR